MDIRERPAVANTGWVGVLVLAACAWWIVVGAQRHSTLIWLPSVLSVLLLISMVVVTPGRTSVVQFFGSYVGTVRRSVSVRVRHFETNHLKVNDADGNQTSATSTTRPVLLIRILTPWT